MDKFQQFIHFYNRFLYLIALKKLNFTVCLFKTSMRIKRNKIVRLANVIKNNDVFNILYLVLFGIVIKFIIKSYNMDLPKQQKSSYVKQIPTLNQAYQIHQDLLKTINQMDTKIEEVIRTHQAQFLLAYRNHIKLMKYQLSQIKERAEQQQKKIMSNERALFLEKQIILFRQEALKLYDKLEQKTQQNEMNKTHNKQLQKVNVILQKQNKELIKNIKFVETKNSLLSAEIQELKAENDRLRNHLIKQTDKTRNLLSKGVTTNTINETDLYSLKPTTPHRDLYLPMPLDSKKDSRHFYSKGKASLVSKSMISKDVKRKAEQILEHQLKNFFLDCLQTIRKQVAQRKVYGYKSEDINQIANWQQFRMIDKLRLLQMFMQNQKMLVWMYQKIFPNRLTQIENYFRNKKKLTTTQLRPKTNSLQINMDQLALPDGTSAENSIKSDLFQEGNLPKVITWSEKKKQNSKKFDIRSRIEIKSGKLNLRQFYQQ